MIVAYLASKFLDWEPPAEGLDWQSCLCPFHGESHPSASISDVDNAFICFACYEKGDLIKYFMRLEEVDYRTAIQRLEGSGFEVPSRPVKQSGRGTSGRKGSAGRSRKLRFGRGD